MGINSQASGERIHIAFYGRTNSGKSSLLNALVGQEVSIVSDKAGTTTDPVNKVIELPGIGASVLIDTAGYGDESLLGELRVDKTEKSVMKADIAVLVLTEAVNYDEDLQWFSLLKKRETPVLLVLNKSDLVKDVEVVSRKIESLFGFAPIVASALRGEGIGVVLEELKRLSISRTAELDLTDNLVGEGDVVCLVMPQDIQAPKGRLILPQVQTIRELLDKGCTVVSTTADRFVHTIGTLTYAPKLIITDSQVFGEVFRNKPKESMLTSFSVLFARYKGDIEYFMQGASVLQNLKSDSRILIAEACSHIPQNEDIGRVKLPALLRKKFGNNIHIEIVSGNDFPEDLSGYDLIIHCGACMFNRRHVLNRVAESRRQTIPMTNYGIALASLAGILDKVVIPDRQEA